MTLVVARKLTDYHIEIVSDTRITDINATNRRSFLVGALKSVILSKPWCLCFAGDVKRAHYTIEKIVTDGMVNFPVTRLLGYLLDMHLESNRGTDFILCELRENAKIHIIKNGDCQEFLAGWIGDYSVFRYYQECYSKSKNYEPSKDSRYHMSNAFRMVVHSSLYPDVYSTGDHVIVTTTTEQGFAYVPYAYAVSVPFREGEFCIKNDVEHGGYAESILVPVETGIGAIAVHMFPRNMGILYHPTYMAEPIITIDVTTSAYIAHLKAVYGLTFTGYENSNIIISRNLDDKVGNHLYKGKLIKL